MVNPYYQDEFVAIYHRDCRDMGQVVPDGSVDLVLTDPPYNVGFDNYDSHDDRMPDADYVALLSMFRGMPIAICHYPEEMMRYVVPALGVPDDVVAWCYNSNLPRHFRLIGVYGKVIDYGAERQPYRNPRDRRVAALIANGSRGAPLYDWWSDIQLVKNVSQQKLGHPCQLPEKLVMRLLKVLTKPGDMVLDPFLGSGTVAACAKVMGRRAVGFEVSEAYCEIAARRCSQSVLDLASVTDSDRRCYVCGVHLNGQRGDSRYCSGRCRQADYRRRKQSPAGVQV